MSHYVRPERAPTFYTLQHGDRGIGGNARDNSDVVRAKATHQTDCFTGVYSLLIDDPYPSFPLIYIPEQTLAKNQVCLIVLPACPSDKNEQVVFRVASDATKPEIKAAVELLFKVQVDNVQVLNVKGKAKRFGKFMGRRKNWKKAYVSLKPGQEINFTAGEQG